MRHLLGYCVKRFDVKADHHLVVFDSDVLELSAEIKCVHAEAVYVFAERCEDFSNVFPQSVAFSVFYQLKFKKGVFYLVYITCL